MGKVNSATYNNGSVFDATVNINTLTSINRTHINVAAQFNSIQFNLFNVPYITVAGKWDVEQVNN